MKNIIDFIIKKKIPILSILFWIFLILVLFTSYFYQSANLKRVKENQTMIEINYKELLKKDSVHKILLKNDSIVIEKLENLNKK
jgi:p-aminobenzoyl-glutamate transporter AbgT